MAAIIGCGAIILLAFVVGYAVLDPLLGDGVSSAIANLIMLWSVPVEGHIIARAIDRHWYIGILIAVGVFVLQLFIYDLMTTSN